MENFRHCPICLEVPEQEIFQCSEGHIICHLCISKVSGGRCPQCRIPFGRSKIRCRVLEEILDSQDFECKFKNNGCAHLSKRGEVTSHANLCAFNPDVPLCQQLRYIRCGFRLGSVSRAEIISHFRDVHHIPFDDAPVRAGSWFPFGEDDEIVSYMESFSWKRNAGVETQPKVTFGALVALNNLETGPLLLLHGKLNWPIGFLSLLCIKVWESDSHPSANLKAEFELSKDPASTSKNPFPIGGSMKVSSLKEANQVIEATPMLRSLCWKTIGLVPIKETPSVSRFPRWARGLEETQGHFLDYQDRNLSIIEMFS